MSCVIVYDEADLGNQLTSAYQKAMNRYSYLKKNILSDASIGKLRYEKIQQVQKFLNQLNAAYANYSPRQVEQILADYAAKTVVNDLSSSLQGLASNSSGFLHAGSVESSKRKNFYQHLGKLYDLYEKSRNKMNNNIDINSFLYEVNKINSYVGVSAQEALSETGNLLGHIGATGGAIMAQNLVEDLTKKPLQGIKAVTYSTGGQKTSVNKKTITTDTMVVLYQQLNENQTEVMATLRISDKFNAKYRTNATSTERPVKLATRQVNTFLSEVKNPAAKDSYEFLLYNYLSYHRTERNGHFARTDWTKTDAAGWRNIRRAIGAEMMNNELYGNGKGSFNLNGTQIEDVIDIYAYGNKLFLGDSILKTLKNRKRNRNQFDAVNVSYAKRAYLIEKPWELESPALIHNEEEAYQVLSTSQISYNQKIVFF